MGESKIPPVTSTGVLLTHSAQLERLTVELASLDAEVARLTETVNRQDHAHETFNRWVRQELASVHSVNSEFRRRIGALESPSGDGWR